MSQIEYYARITWDEDRIACDSQLAGYPPQHSEVKWSLIQAWSVGRPESALRYPEGIYLLIGEAPHYEFLTTRAAGAVALEGELRARGFTELSATEVVTEANLRKLVDLRAEVAGVFGAAADDAWQQLEAEPALAAPGVRTAVVRLCKGDISRLAYFIAQARVDYRDVLLWAQTEHLV